jgi:hypothetical protein
LQSNVFVVQFPWIYDLSDGKLLGCQFLEVIFIASWISIIMFPLFGLLYNNGRFRVNKLEELVSLDAMYFDSPDTPVCSDEICENDEIVRLAAYRQRLAERKLQYDKKNIDETGRSKRNRQCQNFRTLTFMPYIVLKFDGAGRVRQR